MTLSIGDKIPSFSADMTGGQRFDLQEHQGTQIVLYFYPKDSTPGCTTEGLDFSRLNAEFAAANTRVFGISRDSLRKHENFKTKQCFPFDLISDPDETLCRLFDVIRLKKLYGKEYEGIERSTFLIDAQGQLIQEWRKVKVAGHAEAVLAAAQECHQR
ncbi:peroxiredoxin [Zymobacter palmae]|uniref:thioredoxin-dependent peroxiredoxin n=1 Tax=Zymobacter palmae TaxID=33074 RepID=A0A348HFS7_9GAMM|nr:peroxiredoxin [Zymobacter palmae]BBG30479.1 alkyl hydroperoxide reductase/thiol specific antioxidant/Mal allergen [Zymobacter palmae]